MEHSEETQSEAVKGAQRLAAALAGCLEKARELPEEDWLSPDEVVLAFLLHEVSLNRALIEEALSCMRSMISILGGGSK